MVVRVGGRGFAHSVRTTGTTPALRLDFTSGVLDSRVTASGGTNGTRTDATGAIVAASAPRFDYSPTSIGTCLGLLIEDSRTNILLNSLLNGTNLGTQSVTVTAQSYALTFYGTGSIALSGAYTGTLNGSGAYPTRSTLIFTPTAGTLTLTVTGTVQYAQLEAGAFATSFIPTGSGVVSRSFDNISMTGTGFSTWYNSLAGTFVAQFQTGFTTPISANTYVLSFDGSVNKRIIYIGNGANSASNYDGTNILGATGNVILAASKVASAYGASTKQIVSNGGAVVSGPVAAGYSTASTLNIGNIGTTPNTINGRFKSLTYYNTQIPSAKLPTL